VPNVDATARANHTGTQPASTITGLAASATTDTTNAANIGSGVLPAARLPAATATTVGGVVIGSGLGVASGTVSVTYGTASGTACQGNDARLSDARVPTSHTHTVSQVTDAGTIATQNANSVAITGGSINGTTIGATTASTGVFTTVTTTGISHSADNSGIVIFGGTVGSGANIELYGGTGALANLAVIDANEVRFRAANGSAERMRIDGSGNVGIGTTNPAQRLHLYHFTADCVATVQGRTTSLGGSGRAAVQIDVDGHGGFAIQTDATSGTRLLRVISNGGYGSGSVDCMAVTSGGNVGIGTTSPGAKLHVAGSGQGIFIEDTGANRAVLGLYAFNNELRIQGTAYVNAAQPLTVWTANAERMRIDANGNVGIGTTSPGSRLEVIHGGGQGINCLNNGGAGTVNYAVMAQAAGVAGANTGLYVNCFNASANYGVRIINPPAGANNWAIYSDATAQSYFAGNVGIGTTGPTISSGVGLHLAGSTLRLGTARTPASSTATGNQGEVCWDSSYLYVCIATNTWRRIALTTW
jgi:hypothetical protein